MKLTSKLIAYPTTIVINGSFFPITGYPFVVLTEEICVVIISHGSSQYRRVVASTPLDDIDLSIMTSDGTIEVPWFSDVEIFDFLAQKEQYVLDLEADLIPDEYLTPPTPPTEYIEVPVEVPVEVEVVVEQPVFARDKAILTFLSAFVAGRLSKH